MEDRTINDSVEEFCNSSGKLKGKNIILRNIFERLTGVTIYKGNKENRNCYILYKNTELEMKGNYTILGINFKGKRITKKNGLNNLVLNSKCKSFENLLNLAVEKSLRNPKVKKRYEAKLNKVKRSRMERHKYENGLPCNGVGIDFNGVFICSECNLLTRYFVPDLYGPYLAE